MGHKMLKKNRWPFILLLCALASPAMSLDRKSEQAIKHRRAAFTLMSTYFSRLLQTVEGDRPFDAKLVKRDAEAIEMLSKLPWEGFAPGSERGDANTTTRAKDEIWFDEEKFQRRVSDLQQKTAALSKAAATGELANLKVAFAAARESCNNCHDQFRKK
jgi:cytochrome c556